MDENLILALCYTFILGFFVGGFLGVILYHANIKHDKKKEFDLNE